MRDGPSLEGRRWCATKQRACRKRGILYAPERDPSGGRGNTRWDLEGELFVVLRSRPHTPHTPYRLAVPPLVASVYGPKLPHRAKAIPLLYPLPRQTLEEGHKGEGLYSS